MTTEAVLRLDGDYDYILMDCPPSLGVLTLNALCAAREVVIPLQAHFLALHGLSKLLETGLPMGGHVRHCLVRSLRIE